MLKKFLILASALAVLSACGESDPIPNSQVKKLRSDIRGHKVPEGVMLSRDYKPFWKEHVVTGYPQKPHEDFPQKMVELEQSHICKLEPPQEHETVTKINIHGGMKPTNINSWGDADLERETKEFAERYGSTGVETALRYISLGRELSLVNVYVTDQSAPNHLILSGAGDVLWNIHVARYASISNITLIGRGAAGVVNMPGNTKIQSMTGEKAAKCGAVFWRKPDETWRFYQDLKKRGNLERDDTMKENMQLFANFNTWYRKNFEANSDQADVKAYRISNILVGPVPESMDDRLEFRPIKDQVVYMVGGRSTVLATKEQYKKIGQQKVVESTKKLVGNDLSVLNPGS